MGIGISLGLMVSAIATGVAFFSGPTGHPVAGQLPSDWGWSLVMMGTASLLASRYFGLRRITERP